MKSQTMDQAKIKGNVSLNSNLKRKYRAKVASVSPQTDRYVFERSDACFLGVSLENKNFSRPKFESMLEWVSRRFSNCTILIGDSIHRITLESNSGFDSETALSQALKLGDEFIRENCDLVATYSREQTKFAFETCSTIQRTGDYHRFHGSLVEHFSHNKAFRISVERFSIHYNRRTWDSVNAETKQKKLENSCSYFLEEFAVFCCLQQRGLGIMVYPGAFSTLEEVVDGLHPDIPQELRELTIVSLQIKRR